MSHPTYKEEVDRLFDLHVAAHNTPSTLQLDLRRQIATKKYVSLELSIRLDLEKENNDLHDAALLRHKTASAGVPPTVTDHEAQDE